MRRIRTKDLDRFTTLDGSIVRELSHPRSGGSAFQSIAEAEVPAGGSTFEHFHRRSEEIYLFTAGAGAMRLGAEEFDVEAGDLVVIASGTTHKLWAPADHPLRLLCCCVPPYSDEDTVLTEPR